MLPIAARHRPYRWPEGEYMGLRHGLSAALALLSLSGWLADDKAAQAAPGDAPPTEHFSGDSAKGWQAGEQLSRLDGGRSYSAILESLDGTSSSGGQRHAILVVNCSKGTLAVSIIWPDNTPMDYMVPEQVRWRFDNGAPQSQAWMTLPNATASSTPSPREFLAAMRLAHKLNIGIGKPGESGSVDAVFDLDGGQYAMYRQ